jgi:putative PIN family toxin of toxin-antitoxin system
MSLAPGRPKQARTAAREGEGLSSKTPVRVVLDTNVVLSALAFGGGAAVRVRRAWQQGSLLPLASAATVQELVRVLAYPKFCLSQNEQDELLADYLPYAEAVRIPLPPPTVPACRDVLDEPFMHLAVVGKAQALVSGDRDLLAIATDFERASGCPILTLDAFFRHPLALSLLQNV